MNILIYDTDKSSTNGYEDYTKEFNELLKESDIISLHPKLNETSYEMINSKTLKEMRNGVIIINTSRGDVINSNDLLDAIKSGKVRFAALDVLRNEFHSGKLPNDPLIKYALKEDNSDKILITPHAGGATLDAHSLVFKHVAQTLKDKLYE
jgi:phosphoglycerate dehydrogenase-like enzyme